MFTQTFDGLSVQGHQARLLLDSSGLFKLRDGLGFGDRSLSEGVEHLDDCFIRRIPLVALDGFFMLLKGLSEPMLAHLSTFSVQPLGRRIDKGDSPQHI